MHDHIPIIHHNPATRGSSLIGKGQFPIILLDIPADKLGQGTQVAVIVARTDDEKIRDDVVGPQVEQEDVLCLAILDKLHNMTGKFQ